MTTSRVVDPSNPLPVMFPPRHASQSIEQADLRFIGSQLQKRSENGLVLPPQDWARCYWQRVIVKNNRARTASHFGFQGKWSRHVLIASDLPLLLRGRVTLRLSFWFLSVVQSARNDRTQHSSGLPKNHVAECFEGASVSCAVQVLYICPSEWANLGSPRSAVRALRGVKFSPRGISFPHVFRSLLDRFRSCTSTF